MTKSSSLLSRFVLVGALFCSAVSYAGAVEKNRTDFKSRYDAYKQPRAGTIAPGEPAAWSSPPTVPLDTALAWGLGVVCFALLFAGFVASNWRRRTD